MASVPPPQDAEQQSGLAAALHDYVPVQLDVGVVHIHGDIASVIGYLGCLSFRVLHV